MRARSLVVVAALAVLIGARAILAHQTPAQTPSFQAAVDLIRVDVTVIDKQTQQPVRGLRAADFTLLEDDVPQRIVAFNAVDVPPVPVVTSTAGAWTRDVAPDTPTNDFVTQPESRLFVLLFDDGLIPADPHVLQNAKTAAREIIARLSPADRMAIVFTQRGSDSQGFTNDRAALRAAVDRLQAGDAVYEMGWDTAPSLSLFKTSDGSGSCLAAPRPLASDADTNLRVRSIHTLEDATDALLSAPDRRKVFVYIGPGVALNPAVPIVTPQMIPAGLGMTAAKPMGDAESNVQMVDRLPNLFRRMQRANVVVYPIDPTGLGGIGAVVSRNLAGVQALGWPCKGPIGLDGDSAPNTVPDIPELAHFVARLDLDFVETLASNTGGRAIVNTDNFTPGIEQMFVDDGSFYLLGYKAVRPHPDGKFHRWTVRVDRKNVEVRTRSGYTAEAPAKPGKAGPPPPLDAATASLLPISDLPMAAAVAPIAIPGHGGTTAAIVIDVHHLAVPSRTVETITVEARAFTPDGEPRGSEHQSGRVLLVPGRPGDDTRYEILSRFDLKPGRYEIRLAAHRELADTTGSVFADVDIPDFANDPASLSGVFVETTPAVDASPAGFFTSLIPIVPTAVRTFDRSGGTTIFLRAYEGGRAALDPMAVTERVVDTTGRVMFAHDETITPDRFTGDRAADLRFDLPLIAFPPGDYLLTVGAARGRSTAQRLLRFTVQ